MTFNRVSLQIGNSSNNLSYELPADPLVLLPIDITNIIFERLPLRTLLKLEMVSHAWRNFLSSDHCKVWQTFKNTLFPEGLYLEIPFDQMKSLKENIKAVWTTFWLGDNHPLIMKSGSDELIKFLRQLPEVKWDQTFWLSERSFACKIPVRTVVIEPVRAEMQNYSHSKLAIVIPKVTDMIETRTILKFDFDFSSDADSGEEEGPYPMASNTTIKRAVGTEKVQFFLDKHTEIKSSVSLPAFIEAKLKQHGAM